ncbi:MAG: response regulator transcription factor [Candidatus Pacebacteria bacterium]|nr:response regulator transcription factor [Candidatus Paceibacterota bacterium]
MKILIIDDDNNLGLALKRFLQSKGAVLDYESQAKKGLKLAETQNYDFLLVDYAMPEISGEEIIETLRDNNNSLAIIAMSVMNQAPNRVKLLNSGADYYLNKPFSLEELWATIKALSRRSSYKLENKQLLKHKGFEINQENFTVKYKNKKLDLSAKELELLIFLINNQGKILSRQEILEKIWDINANLFTNSIDVHISNLRKKLKPFKAENLIKTIKNKGYLIE